MNFSIKIFVLFLLCSSVIFGQELSREQKLQKIDELNSQIKLLENDVILPDEKDLKQAQKEGFSVFRLNPREKYDRKFTVQGGGSYYSFTTKSHDYQKISQIGLEQNYLKVGFAGADYGFIADLGETPLADISGETSEVNFLVNYRPPTDEPDVRVEQRKASNYEANGFTYKERFPAVVGHSYILRAISFDRADILVALRIHRKDSDGSLIIFWKLIEQFEKPILNRSNLTLQKQSDTEFWHEKVSNALIIKGFYNVTVDVSTIPMTLRGTVPKGKLAEVVLTAMEANGGKPVKNEINEK